MHALNGVDVELHAGERVGIVGESGCGKSTLLRMLLALEAPDEGTVSYRDQPVQPGGARSLRWFRSEVQFVPQDPWSSLNPRMRIGDAIAEPLRYLRVPVDREQRVADVLRLVGLEPEMAGRRPAAFSGGQRQRIAIARALAPSPRFLLADEPVTALDASVRSRVLGRLRDLVEPEGLGLLLVTHDLAVVRRLCDRVMVMRAGEIVEHGSTDDVFGSPTHDYTRTLLDSVPRLSSCLSEGVVE
ncbi:ABC transporter ATP-binding protein [Saccharopolyspora erythraea]|uniref:Oligopeptide ABC transporter ATP-binding protein n=1 Tax=Saccharopolyspora erythraea (strain ATCC 11635 / DSM 40517 / JCM 4748 / NBRC 13426 / NCIMB 8594 / NRRL 2338) TaxID=405948 RepID=A4FD29_SACEN|nr:ABC transporter ATP-binding protein [Saccharopolyspora erythraea]QRK93529.1 ABC transporter ATP-binding protein [Saccharopolyspora erythraea]CAM01954.1 putative oligopeptide ABC transporter ATP-binding protein [Saccharopolyspora erythraea NRRL 2338]